MAAGDSAREVSHRTTEASTALRRKADLAAQMSAAFAAGAAGEREVTHALQALSRYGWASVDDRSLSSSGNVDLLRIGPPGVAVIATTRSRWNTNFITS